MNINTFKNLDNYELEDQLSNPEILGIVKFNLTTKRFNLITVADNSKAFSINLDGNIRIGNNQPENELVINFEEVK